MSTCGRCGGSSTPCWTCTAVRWGPHTTSTLRASPRPLPTSPPEPLLSLIYVYLSLMPRCVDSAIVATNQCFLRLLTLDRHIPYVVELGIVRGRTAPHQRRLF